MTAPSWRASRVVEHSPERTKSSVRRALIDPFEQLWQFRFLLIELVKRDLSARFKASILGWLWAVVAPVIMLVIYTFSFRAATGIGGDSSFADRALLIFVGFILFTFCAEIWSRAPQLMIEHVGFLKRTAIPSELLAWTAIGRALAYSVVSFAVFFVGQLVFRWTLPPTAIFLPVILVAYALMFVGAAWFLAAMGAFTRDLTYLMASILPLLMFVGPILFTLDEVPAGLRGWLYLNPMTPYLEMARDVAFHGRLPALFDIGVGLAWLFAFFVPGWLIFRRFKWTAIDAI